MSKFIMFILVLVVYIRKSKLNLENIEIKQLAVLSILPITTIFMIVIMYHVMFFITSAELKILFVFSSVLMILSNIITFYVINRQNRLSKAEYELKLLSENQVTIKESSYVTLSQQEIADMAHFSKLKTNKLLNDNAVVLDIGAHIGNHSLYWANERNARKIYSLINVVLNS